VNQRPAAEAALDFLQRFTAANHSDSEGGDAGELGGCFADVFLAGDASGARPVPREAFLAAVPRRRQMFAEAGVGEATLTSHAVMELDDHYLLVRTEWSAPRLDGGAPVELSSSFLLHRSDDTATAIAYLNHQGL
jgi:hypothetical protein